MPPAEAVTPEEHLLWLEELPQEAIDCIVSMLEDFGTPTADTFSLACVSQKLRRLVCNAHKAQVDLLDHSEIDALYQLFGPDIKGLRSFSDTPDHPALSKFLRSETLSTVSIPANEDLTTQLLVKKTVRELELMISNQNHGDHIRTLLKSLHLTKLSLDCRINSPAKHCLLNSELTDPKSGNSIADLCPHLEELHISCTRDNRDTIYWRLIENLPIKRATLRKNVRKEAWHQLREMDSVSLQHVRDPVYHAERIGESVTEFVTQDLLCDVDLGIMRGCPRLEVLDISVKVENAAELCELVGSLPDLREMMLVFNRHTMYSGKRGKSYYEKMEDGDLLKVIEAAPSLQKLRLYGLQIAGEELDTMLRVLGGSLVEFSTCLKGQAEDMFERLERLLDCLCRYNHRISVFSLLEGGDAQRLKSNLRRKGKDLAKRRRQQKETGKRLGKLIQALKRRSRFQDAAYGRVGDLIEVLK